MIDLLEYAGLILPIGIILPLVFAGLIAMTKRGSNDLVRMLALVGTLIPVAWYIPLASAFDWSNGGANHFVAKYEWFAPLGLTASFGADVITMLLLGLTVLLGPICVLASYSAITERVRTYYCWLLILQSAMTGVFVARDLMMFYVFFEFTLVPLYILINLFGSTNRKAAATKFFLYTFTGSLVTLAGLVFIAWQHQIGRGSWSFDFETLRNTARGLSFEQQSWLFWAMLAGFAIKVPLFPVHTWLPLAHTEAPTAGSVILAGVLLKLGTYGIYRFVIDFLPAASTYFAPTLAVLSIIGILYAGLICWVQTDVKKLVAYSSVSHLGYCVLGLFALNSVGLTGSVLYMINHGLSTGALFLLIGFMYERYHTRSLKEVGGLAKVMPIWASFMVFFTMASVGLPGLNGFVSEIMCLLGAFQASGRHWGLGGGTTMPGGTWGELGPYYAFVAGIGVIITAMYLLIMLGKIVWGPLKEPGGHGDHGGHGGHGHDDHGAHGGLSKDLNAREIGVLLPLAALCLVLGLYPQPILKALEVPTRDLARSIDRYGRQQLPVDDPRVKTKTPATAQASAASLDATTPTAPAATEGR